MSDNPLDAAGLEGLDFVKGDGLLPAIVQHAETGTVLMLGYMNRDALAATLARGKAVFFSRSKGRLWEKGETSGHHIAVERIVTDCDRDALLILGRPAGPTCHTGASTCFMGTEPAVAKLGFMATLEQIVAQRLSESPEGSYTTSLVREGPHRLAQKVGEEALEVALAASGPADELLSEAADLVFHLIVLLKARGLTLADVTRTLEVRHEMRDGVHRSRRPTEFTRVDGQ
jgi:phosphoribosyl-ATP pyrophosphohydrolase/phosphoribosyl-AMP cyclohydrolase